MQIIKKHIFDILMIFVIALGFLTIFTFSKGIHDYDIYDYLEGIKWSVATIESKSLLSPTFLYPYAIPIGSNVLFLPFVLLVGPTLIANQLGMSLFFIIYLIGIFYLGNSIIKEKDKRYIFIIVTTLFIFTYIGDNLLHHILYYGIAFVCSIYEVASIIRINKREKVKLNTIIIIVCTLVSSINGLSTVVLSTFATLVTIIIYLSFFIDKKSQKTRNNIYIYI